MGESDGKIQMARAVSTADLHEPVLLPLGFGRVFLEPNGIYETGHRVLGQEVACQRRELAAGIVRLGVPLLDGTEPRVVMLGQRREGVDERVARLSAKLADHRPLRDNSDSGNRTRRLHGFVWC